VTVLQPTVVYGPRATVHAADILEEMREGPLVLVDGGSGTCNAVYVDDVVTALLLASVRDRAVGHRILVSGPGHPTWAEFFGSFERMLGRTATVCLDEEEALELWNASQRRASIVGEGLRVYREEHEVRSRLLATREGALARTVVKRVAPGLLPAVRRRVRARRPPALPDEASGTPRPTITPSRPWVVQYLAKQATVRIDTARDLLGYAPEFDLSDGMRLTEAWARWARLLD
jgi:nucleoside-diphosphate-sugar epimerase